MPTEFSGVRSFTIVPGTGWSLVRHFIISDTAADAPPAPRVCIVDLHTLRVRPVRAADWPANTLTLSFEVSYDDGDTWEEKRAGIGIGEGFECAAEVCAGMRARFTAQG